MMHRDSVVRGGLWVFVIATLVPPAPARAEFSLAPGHLYATHRFAIHQFSPGLDLLGWGGPLFEGATGAAISHEGLYVYSVSRPSGVWVVGMNGAGEIVRERMLNEVGLNGASHIAVDRQGRIYVTAPSGVIELAPDFSTARRLSVGFGRASGIAVGPNNWLYVSDQTLRHVKILNGDRDYVGSFPTGPVPTGVGFDPDGFLYYVDTPFTGAGDLGRLMRVDTMTGEQTAIHPTGLPFPVDIEFLPDGSYYLLSRNWIRLYDPAGELVREVPNTIGTDSIVFYIPEPTSGAVVVAMMFSSLAARRTRRRSRALGRSE